MRILRGGYVPHLFRQTRTWAASRTCYRRDAIDARVELRAFVESITGAVLVGFKEYEAKEHGLVHVRVLFRVAVSPETASAGGAR